MAIEGRKSTKTGLTVKLLQDTLPHARVVYCSPTAVTEPLNMVTVYDVYQYFLNSFACVPNTLLQGYMTRLGLWGPGTAFEDSPDGNPDTDAFHNFINAMSRGGE